MNPSKICVALRDDCDACQRAPQLAAIVHVCDDGCFQTADRQRDERLHYIRHYRDSTCRACGSWLYDPGGHRRYEIVTCYNGTCVRDVCHRCGYYLTPGDDYPDCPVCDPPRPSRWAQIGDWLQRRWARRGRG